MNKFAIISLGVVVALAAIAGFISASKKVASPENEKAAPLKIINTNMTITSPNFQHNAFIPKQFTCEGENTSPELHIGSVPENAKALALIMDDPDAPNGTFTHWLVWNIAPKTAVIPQNVKVIEAVAAPTDVVAPPKASLAKGGSLARQIVGREGKNSAGKSGYIGPCPPPGKPHRYFFKLYALDSFLNLPAGADKNSLESEINARLLAKAELSGMYQR